MEDSTLSQIDLKRIEGLARSGDAALNRAGAVPDPCDPERIAALISGLADYHEASALALRVHLDAQREGDEALALRADSMHAALMEGIAWAEPWAFNPEDAALEFPKGLGVGHYTMASIV